MDKNKKKEILFLHKRMNVVANVYNLLKNVALNNPDSQIFLSKFLPQLNRYIGFGGYVSSTLRAIVNDNDEILMNFSKLRGNLSQHESETGTKGNLQTEGLEISSREVDLEASTSFGFDFFVSSTDALKNFEPYKKHDILNFLEKLCFTSNKSFYLNQNSILNAIKRPEIQKDH